MPHSLQARITLTAISPLFAIKTFLNINYLRPAFFEDILVVQTSINQLSRVKLNFHQKILRHTELLVDAEVMVIPVNTEGKIIRLDEELFSFLKTIS